MTDGGRRARRWTAVAIAAAAVLFIAAAVWAYEYRRLGVGRARRTVNAVETLRTLARQDPANATQYLEKARAHLHAPELPARVWLPADVERALDVERGLVEAALEEERR